MRELIHRMDGDSRRAFLGRAASSFLGVSVLSGLGARSAHAAREGREVSGHGTATSVIYIYLGGGMSHIDSLDPKPGQPTAGEFRPVSTAVDGITISEKLPRLATQMGHCAIIRSMTSKQGAHERGRYLMHTSYNQLATIQHASIGAWVNKALPRQNHNIPSNVLIGNGDNEVRAGFLGSQYEPLIIGDPSAGLQNIKLVGGIDQSTFDHRRSLLDQLDTRFRDRFNNKGVKAYTEYYDEAVRMMKSSDVQAFELDREPQAIQSEYGSERFGRGCLLARRLVEHGVRFVEITNGGWDTHTDNFERLDEKLTEIDRGISALLHDLHRRGLLESTLVVLATEFGRTPKITERGGRDHYPRVFSCMLAGGGVRGGRVYGASDTTGAAVASDAVSPQDLNATIAYAMGIDHRMKVISKIGRPFTLSDEGSPVTGLFA